jgi:hypothetical protein
MSEIVPIFFRPPVITCLPNRNSLKINDLVLIFCARVRGARALAKGSFSNPRGTAKSGKTGRHLLLSRNLPRQLCGEGRRAGCFSLGLSAISAT